MAVSITEDDYLPEDDAAETFGERILGLTEMFPETLRNAVGKTVDLSNFAVKKSYSLSRSLTWLFFSSSCILFAPLMIEMERHQIEEMQKAQQREMLLGPNAAFSR